MIEITDLSLVYPSRRAIVHALDHVSLCASAGEFISLVGPSGCGKSTMLKVIAGLLPPTSGSVRVNAKEVRGPARSIGIVFQSPLLMPWRTVLRNVLLQIEMRGMRAFDYRAKALSLLHSVGLNGFENAYAHELSGGMQQRVGICRALIHDPDLLLMDEPFAALDAMTREQMAAELQRIWTERRKTVLFITHSISEAIFLGDRVIVLNGRPGTVLADIPITFSRPRNIDDIVGTPQFADHSKMIRKLLHRDRLVPTSVAGS